MEAESAAVCQCNSCTPPAFNLISTPAIDFETPTSRTVTSRDQLRPYWTALLPSEQGSQHLLTGAPLARDLLQKRNHAIIQLLRHGRILHFGKLAEECGRKINVNARVLAVFLRDTEAHRGSKAGPLGVPEQALSDSRIAEQVEPALNRDSRQPLR